MCSSSIANSNLTAGTYTTQHIIQDYHVITIRRPHIDQTQKHKTSIPPENLGPISFHEHRASAQRRLPPHPLINSHSLGSREGNLGSGKTWHQEISNSACAEEVPSSKRNLQEFPSQETPLRTDGRCDDWDTGSWAKRHCPA